jgi:hypothetical protein
MKQNVDCQECGKNISRKTNFYFHCKHCEAIVCADCGIDADTNCPNCGGSMDDFNEGV